MMLQRLHSNNVEGMTQFEILDLIVERHRRRTSWHKAEKSLTLQGRSICRRLCLGDKDAANELFDRVAKLKPEHIQGVLANFSNSLSEDEILAVFEIHPILVARYGIEIARAQVEAELEMMVQKLPIINFIEQPACAGVGPGSLAAIIGAAGNLHTYATPQKLWKRMGLAVMPNGRQRQQRDAKQAKLHGYSPQRRSVMWNIGTSILRTQSERTAKEIDPKTGKKVSTGEVTREAGVYRLLYDKRKAYESAKNEAGDYAEQAAKRLSEANFDKKTMAYKMYSAGKLPPLHLHARAQRYIEKRFLLELWVAWTKIMKMPPAPVLVRQEEKEPA